jgi:hypothetical protein
MVHSGGAKLDAAGGPSVEESILNSMQAVHIPSVQQQINEPAEPLVSPVLEHDPDGRLSTGSSADLSVQDSVRWVQAARSYKGLAHLRGLVQSEWPKAFRKIGASAVSKGCKPVRARLEILHGPDDRLRALIYLAQVDSQPVTLCI